MAVTRQSIRRYTAQFKDPAEFRALRVYMMSQQQDMANLRAAIVALTAKLDLDAGVTDTNYASLTNPPALFVQPY